MFTIDSDLPRSLYPLAWLVGSWRGFVTIGEETLVQEIQFVPQAEMLRQTTTRIEAIQKDEIPVTATASQGLAKLVPGSTQDQEVSLWSITKMVETKKGGAITSLRVTVGSSVWTGSGQGPRVQIGHDKSVRLFGLVGGELMWLQETGGKADFSARLEKVIE